MLDYYLELFKQEELPRVYHLTVDESEKILKEGILLSQLSRYRNTVVASNVSFWDHLGFLWYWRAIDIQGDVLKNVLGV